MKLGFGATFSRTGKFSSLMLCEAWVEVSLAVYESASSPMTMALDTRPCANHALTVSTTEAFKPGWYISGCLIGVLFAILLREFWDRIDCASEPR